MHPVIEFYLEQRKSQHNLSLQDMWAMPKRMVGDAYLYIPWLLPVTESSKWNRSVPVFNECVYPTIKVTNPGVQKTALCNTNV